MQSEYLAGWNSQDPIVNSSMSDSISLHLFFQWSCFHDALQNLTLLKSLLLSTINENNKKYSILFFSCRLCSRWCSTDGQDLLEAVPVPLISGNRHNSMIFKDYEKTIKITTLSVLLSIISIIYVFDWFSLIILRFKGQSRYTQPWNKPSKYRRMFWSRIKNTFLICCIYSSVKEYSSFRYAPFVSSPLETDSCARIDSDWFWLYIIDFSPKGW